MKTKRVRPILVESKESTLHLSHGKLLITSIESTGKSDLYKSIPQELILISLEDEEIEENDYYYFSKSNSLHKHLGTLPLNKYKHDGDKCFKVIARQSQIPQEYISKFIEQYNQGCIEDLEIEMEKCWINSDNVKGNSFTEVAKFEPSINDFDAVLIIQPKLTNGFVTIVEKDEIIGKPLDDYIKQKHNQDRCIGFIDGYQARKSEEPSSYTEEEVRKLISEALYHFCPMNNHREEDEIDWFENNKKK